MKPLPKMRQRASEGLSEKRLDRHSSTALFQEFLLWQKRQSTPDTTLEETDRDALFREFLAWQERQGRADSK